MRTSTAAWTAALAFMSMHGPFTTAEAAPARNYEGERPKYYFPKEVKRERANTNSTVQSPPAAAPVYPATSEVGAVPEDPAAAPTSSIPAAESPAGQPSSGWFPDFDPSAWLASMMGEGALPQTGADSVMTSIVTKTWQSPRPVTQTYTVTWTQTATSTPGSSSMPLPSSSSVAAPSQYVSEPVVQPSAPASTSSVPAPEPYSQEPVEESTPSPSSSSVPPPSQYSPEPESVVEPTPYSSAPAPSQYSPEPESVVEPTPPASPESEPETTTSTTPSAYVPTSIVLPTSSSSSSVPPPPPPSTPSSPSVYSPPVAIPPSPPSSNADNSPSAYAPPEVVRPTPNTKPKPSAESPTEVVEPTRTGTRHRHRPTGDAPSAEEPEVVVPPTPYTPKTTAASSPEPTEDAEELTPFTVDVPSSSYAIISSRSFSIPANTSYAAPWAMNTSSSSSYYPTAYESPSISSRAASSSSTSSEAIDLPIGLPTSAGLPTSILSPTIPHSQKHHSTASEEDEEPSRPQHGRPGRPSDATSDGIPDIIVSPTPKSSSGDDETATPTGSSSGGLPIPTIAPTPHSSEHGEEQTRPTGDSPEPTGEHPEGSGGWPFNFPHLTGGLQSPDSEPTPTPRSSNAANGSATSNSSTAPIIVGLSTVIESHLPLPTSGDSPSADGTRPAAGNPFGSIGLTGLPTGVLPTPSAKPSGSDASENGEDGHGQGRPGHGTGRPDFDPFGGLGITGQPTGVIPTGLPVGTGGNDSNPGKPDGGPIRPPGQSADGTGLPLGLPTDPITLPTSLPLGPSNGSNDTGANDTNGIVPIPLPTPESATDSDSSKSDGPETGLGGILPTGASSAGLPILSSGGLTSALSEVTGGVGGILTDSEPSPTRADAATTTPAALGSIASSLDDQLSSIVATATDPALSGSLASEYSSILTSAASSLASEASVTDAIPEPATTPIVNTPGTTIPLVDTTIPLDTLGTTIGTPAPTPGAESPAPSYTLSTSTGSDGIPAAIPVPNTTPTTTPEKTSAAEETPIETYESQTLPGPTKGSTVSTSIPLGTGATVPIVSSGTAPVSPSDYPTTTPAEPSEEPSETPVVPIPTTPSDSESPETTPVSTPQSTPPTTPTPSPSSETSIEPTGTNTDTDYTLPSSWNFAPTTGTTAASITDTLVQATSTTGEDSNPLPTYMPRLIQPPGGMPSPANNATLIQLGLNYGLNFPFIVREQDAASQIFAYLPQGIAYGLGISHEKVKMNALMPYDTSKSLSFITTLAQAYVPAEMVDQLSLDLHSPMSSMYTNPDDMIRTLMNMINPTIPILPGASMDGDDSSSAPDPGATGGPSSNQGAPIGGDTGASQPVRGSSVGIGVGAVCGAAAYAAAMVYVARRYKKKRLGHQRASSVPTAGEMSETGNNGMGGFFMSGGRGSSAAGSGGNGSRNSGHSSNGRSVREQGISAPVMSENSLGWN